MKLALITGASSGLGRAFVQVLEQDPEVGLLAGSPPAGADGAVGCRLD